jgi:hypothetical protein
LSVFHSVIDQLAMRSRLIWMRVGTPALRCQQIRALERRQWHRQLVGIVRKDTFAAYANLVPGYRRQNVA